MAQPPSQTPIRAQPPAAYPASFVGEARLLEPGDFRAAAAVLQLSIVRIRAVDEVESRGRGFHPDSRRPIILFEPHVFSKLTGGRFDASHPDVSYPKAGERDYPGTQSQRYVQLAQAVALNEVAALKSASWGRYQIMGFNHEAAGYTSVQAFVGAMCRSEGEQLLAFVRFLKANPAMLEALRLSDWSGFARLYNGRNFAAHGYDQRLKAAFARLTAAEASAQA